MKELGPHIPIVQQAHSRAELAAAIAAEHKAYEAAGRRTLEHARQIGEFLRKAKFLCRHGEWLPWLKANTSFGRTQAFRYMRIAAEWVKCSGAEHLQEAFEMLAVGGEDEQEVAEPDVEGKDWRSMPLSEFLIAEDYVWEQLDAGKVKTAGEMYARLMDGATFGLMGGDIKATKQQIEKLDGFSWGKPTGGGSRRSSGSTSGSPAKQGAIKFDWADYETHLGKCIRGVDNLCKAYPEERKSPERQTADRALDELATVVKQWKKKVAKLDKED